MSIRPHGDRVLVELLPDEKPAGMIVRPQLSDRQREINQPLERGIIRGIGGKCKIPVQVGDEVMVFTNHGMELPGTIHRLYFSQHVVLKKEANA